MACEKNGICDFISHMEKLVMELPQGEEREEHEKFIREIEKNFCAGDVIGQNVYYDGVMSIVGCSFHNVTCCPRFPCGIVKSRRSPMFFVSEDDFLNLCLGTCTSLGRGRCIEMGKLDFNTMFGGGDDITLSKPIREKFKGL